MYRAVTFAALRRMIDPDEVDVVGALAEDLDMDVVDAAVTVDGVDATLEIRGPEVTSAVSIVAANPRVRAELRYRQREWAEKHGGGVIEGRDIGSVVFPEAELKVYLTASEDVRAARRHQEVAELDYEETRAMIADRDALDSTRADSPLREADDAVLVDTTDLGVEEIVDRIVALLDRARRPTRAERRRVTDVDTTLAGGSWVSRAFYQLARGVCVGFCRVWFRMTVEGLEHVPRAGPFVLAPVHRSNMDTPIVCVVTRRRLRYMGKDSLWKKPFPRWFLSALGGFPVTRGQRGQGGAASAASPCSRTASRWCCSRRVSARPVRSSSRCSTARPSWPPRPACRSCPSGIGGSEQVMPKGSKLIYPRKVHLIVGRPIVVPGADQGRVPRAVLAEVTATLHDELQRLFDAAEARTAGGKPAASARATPSR